MSQDIRYAKCLEIHIMKLKTTIIFCLIGFSSLISTDLFSQGYNFQFDKEILKDNAKSVTLKSKGCHGKRFEWKVKQEIDTNGQILKQDSYYKGKFRSSYKYFYDIYGYDSLFIEDFNFNTPDIKQTTSISIKLNAKKQLIEYISQTDNENYKLICKDFEYDTLNRLKSYSYIFGDSFRTTLYRYRLIYDKNNQLIKRYIINSDSIMKGIEKYTYDRKGNIKSLITESYFVSNRQQYEDESFDDFMNNNNLEQMYNIRLQQSKWKYCYDRKGNWIRKYKKRRLFYRLEEKRRIKY